MSGGWTITYTTKAAVWADHVVGTYLEAVEEAKAMVRRFGGACRYTIVPAGGER